jgi:hypothetical protein
LLTVGDVEGEVAVVRWSNNMLGDSMGCSLSCWVLLSGMIGD